MTGLIPFSRNFFSDWTMNDWNIGSDVFKIDVKETDKQYTVDAELPGVRKEEINLNTDDRMLSISVNREENVNEEKENYIHRERRASSMSRSIRLADANLGDIKAKLDGGVLTVMIPKQDKSAAGRRIEIE